MKKYLLLAILLTAPLLSACSGGKNAALAPRCPETGLMREADSIALFSGNPAVLTADIMTARASFGSYRGACRPSRHGGMDFMLEFDFQAERGQTATDTKDISLPYFVALLAPDETIVSRESHQVDISLNDKGLGKKTDKLRIHVPVRDLRDAWKFKVVAGFALNPQQLEYNQAKINGQEPAVQKSAAEKKAK